MSTIFKPLGIACVAFLSLWISLAAAGAAEPGTPSRVTRVTLYRGQALVTRTVPLEGPKGASEVVVADIPEQVVADSLYAEGGEGVEVRAVRYRAGRRAGTPRGGAKARRSHRGHQRKNAGQQEEPGSPRQAGRLSGPNGELHRGHRQDRPGAGFPRCRRSAEAHPLLFRAAERGGQGAVDPGEGGQAVERSTRAFHAKAQRIDQRRIAHGAGSGVVRGETRGGPGRGAVELPGRQVRLVAHLRGPCREKRQGSGGRVQCPGATDDRRRLERRDADAFHRLAGPQRGGSGAGPFPHQSGPRHGPEAQHRQPGPAASGHPQPADGGPSLQPQRRDAG